MRRVLLLVIAICSWNIAYNAILGAIERQQARQWYQRPYHPINSR